MGIKQPTLNDLISASNAQRRKKSREPSTLRFEIVDIPKKGLQIFLLCLSAYIIGFCAFALYSERGAAKYAVLLVVTAVFIGAAGVLIVLAIETLGRRVRVSVEDDSITYERRSFWRLESFTEKLDSYLCVYPLTEISGGTLRRTTMAFYAKLVHGSEPAKNVGVLVHSLDELGMIFDQGSVRVPLEEFACALRLPLASVSYDGSVRLRQYDELDEPIAKAELDVAGPDRPFPSRRFGVVLTDDGFVSTRKNPVFGLPCLGFLAGGAAFAIFFTRKYRRWRIASGHRHLRLLHGLFRPHGVALQLDGKRGGSRSYHFRLPLHAAARPA
ncbi:MAG TPA: hypothetical protein DIC34_01330 [Treponema sp.]|nr:MAG: hypothetical protein A2Y36_17550 [Treponema sp. GWA1_62_8]OHE62995.1 MAG: hypothetical protein A2001_06665 [Treponema sp. GWC1_61_84]HCM25187.1 hypothetical protein [Treponema sp.]